MKKVGTLSATRFSNQFAKNTLVAAATLVLISGCASVDFKQSLSTTNRDAAGFTDGNLALIQTQEQRVNMDKVAAEILATPLSQSDAVRLALMNSPALQALLAQSWADSTKAAQTGRISNPVLSFESLRFADELELSRLLSFGLLDILTLPQRTMIANRRIAQQQLQLTVAVVDQITQVRQAWVRAIAAQQSLGYANQVNEAAQASSELARRLYAAGNFNKLQRALQQAVYADAVAQLAAAQHASVSTREELARLLGLTDSQLELLVLPERLPDLPQTPRTPEMVGQWTSQSRLDIQLAKSEYEGAARAQGLNAVTSFTDIELGVRRGTVFDSASDTKIPKRGYEVSVRLPLFDWGSNQRDTLNAQTLAAANRLEATVRAAGSGLRESYSAYRTAFDLSKHFRDEVVPLRKSISEENLLHYNGMLIGVFELLADARNQRHSVLAAIQAEQQFWLADAALQSTMLGKPTKATAGAMVTGGGVDAGH